MTYDSITSAVYIDGKVFASIRNDMAIVLTTGATILVCKKMVDGIYAKIDYFDEDAIAAMLIFVTFASNLLKKCIFEVGCVDCRLFSGF